jgi:hypothetical protein
VPRYSAALRKAQGGVEITPHLRDALIAELAEEGRRLVVFEHAPALLILEQNDPQRRVETGGKLMARHFRGGERIADFILHGISLAAGDLQQGAMLAREEDRQLRPVLVVILRALLIAPAQGLGDAGIELWDGVLKLAADLCERLL